MPALVLLFYLSFRAKRGICIFLQGRHADPSPPGESRPRDDKRGCGFRGSCGFPGLVFGPQNVLAEINVRKDRKNRRNRRRPGGWLCYPWGGGEMRPETRPDALEGHAGNRPHPSRALRRHRQPPRATARRKPVFIGACPACHSEPLRALAALALSEVEGRNLKRSPWVRLRSFAEPVLRPAPGRRAQDDKQENHAGVSSARASSFGPARSR